MDTLLMGLDGGGTHTRVLLVDPAGGVRAQAESGGCNPEWQPPEDCAAHVRGAVEAALRGAGANAAQVAGVVAGIAGLNRRQDEAWARGFIEAAGLACPSLCVNDRVIAHQGAFLGAPGVMAVIGTGAALFAVTDGGRQVSAEDFGYFGPPAAIGLVRQALIRVAADEAGDADRPLVEALLSRLGLPDARGLREALLERRISPRAMGDLAPLVTAAAEERGEPLARALCDTLAEDAVRGIRLLAACFGHGAVPVALVGGLVGNPYVRRAVEEALLSGPGRACLLRAPALPPVGGAALMALQRHGVPATPELALRLAQGLPGG